MTDPVPNPRDVIAHSLSWDRSAPGYLRGVLTLRATRDADAALKALADAGLVVVPREPSDEDIERAAYELAPDLTPEYAAVDVQPKLRQRQRAVTAIRAFLAPYQQTED